MSKTKKYLLLVSGILLAAAGVVMLAFALQPIINPLLIKDIAQDIIKQFPDTTFDYDKVILWVQIGVGFLAAEGIVSLGFGAFGIRYSFFTSNEFEAKRSIIVTMGIVGIVLLNLFAIPLLVGGLMKDINYVPTAPELSVESLEEKLKKLLDLKEKNLISEEEYNNLRANILNNK